MHKVKDSDRRIVMMKDGSYFIACGVDIDGFICAIDYVNANGSVRYCLSINGDENPYADALAILFDKMSSL